MRTQKTTATGTSPSPCYQRHVSYLTKNTAFAQIQLLRRQPRRPSQPGMDDSGLRLVVTQLRNELVNCGEVRVGPEPLDKLHENAMTIELSLIHISEPTRRTPISYAVFCL